MCIVCIVTDTGENDSIVPVVMLGLSQHQTVKGKIALDERYLTAKRYKSKLKYKPSLCKNDGLIQHCCPYNIYPDLGMIKDNDKKNY